MKKYEGLLCNNKCEVLEINQTTDTHKDTDGGHNIESSSRNVPNKTNKNYTYWDTRCKYNEFGHIAKECKNIPTNVDQFENTTQDSTMMNMSCWEAH